MIDYYETLGVSPSDDVSTITTAYRKLALKYHPDKNKNDSSSIHRFAQIHEAYRLLVDKDARAAFDRVRVIRISQREQQKHFDERKKALRADLLNREELYRREREDVERRDAERKLQIEVARLQAEADLKKKKEAGRSGTICNEELRTLKYTILGKKFDLNSLFPGASSIIPNRNDPSGLIIFKDIPSAREAQSSNIDGVILEWALQPESLHNSPDHVNNVYDLMTEEELESLTLKRLKELS